MLLLLVQSFMSMLILCSCVGQPGFKHAYFWCKVGHPPTEVAACFLPSPFPSQVLLCGRSCRVGMWAVHWGHRQHFVWYQHWFHPVRLYASAPATAWTFLRINMLIVTKCLTNYLCFRIYSFAAAASMFNELSSPINYLLYDSGQTWVWTGVDAHNHKL